MMLKEKDFIEKIMETTVEGNENVDVDILSSAIQRISEDNQLPIALDSSTVKLGGLFQSRTGNALLIYHPEHKKDYFHFAVCLIPGQNKTDVMVYTMGKSKNQQKMEARKRGKSKSKHAGSYLLGNDVMQGFSVGANVMSAVPTLLSGVIKTVWGASATKSKREAETSYYAAVQEILATIFP